MTETTEQPLPTRNDHPSIQGLVRADLDTREQVGIDRYGTALQPYNGRDGLRDAYEEALDLTTYLRQVMVERETEPQAWQRVAEVEAANQRLDDLNRELRRQLRFADRALDRLDARVPNLPPTITVLCGSTRFGDAFRDANLRLTLAAHIVLSIGCDMKSDNELWSDADEAVRIKAELDELHKRKIDLADDVYVLNVDGYIGESTRSEIDYAVQLGKPINYLVPLDGGGTA